jgi:cytochrome P450
MRLTLGIICKSVLNYDVESEAQEVGKALTTVRKYSKRLQSPIGHVLDKIPILPAPRRAREARKELDSLVYGLISDRRQQEESDNDKRYDDLLSRLMQAQESNIADHVSHNGVPFTSTSNEKMSDKQVRDEVMTIFIAGHETTSNALTWTFYLLSQYPDVERKLHDEIELVLGNNSSNNAGFRIPTADDIPKLQYTEMVLRESMRLYPPVWTIMRSQKNSIQISGQMISRLTCRDSVTFHLEEE